MGFYGYRLGCRPLLVICIIDNVIFIVKFDQISYVNTIDEPVKAYSRVYTHRNPWLWLTFCFCLGFNFDHLLLWISFEFDFRAYPDLAELEVIMLKCKSISKAKADPKPKMIKIQT